MAVHVERHEKVSNDLIVERDVQAMPDVVRGRPPFSAQVAGRGNGERPVAVVPQPRQRVIEEERGPLPTDARAVERREQRAWIHVRVHLDLMLARRGV